MRRRNPHGIQKAWNPARDSERRAASTPTPAASGSPARPPTPHPVQVAGRTGLSKPSAGFRVSCVNPGVQERGSCSPHSRPQTSQAGHCHHLHPTPPPAPPEDKACTRGQIITIIIINHGSNQDWGASRLPGPADREMVSLPCMMSTGCRKEWALSD